MRPVLLATAIALIVLTGCITGNRPIDCDAASVTVELSLSADALTPSDPAACRDQEVTLRIGSEVDGFIHIHGYEDAVSATEVTAGEELDLTFTAVRDGQYPIEFHPAEDPEGISVGVLTIHEP
jgi:hypothetical protein